MDGWLNKRLCFAQSISEAVLDKTPLYTSDILQLLQLWIPCRFPPSQSCCAMKWCLWPGVIPCWEDYTEMSAGLVLWPCGRREGLLCLHRARKFWAVIMSVMLLEETFHTHTWYDIMFTIQDSGTSDRLVCWMFRDSGLCVRIVKWPPQANLTFLIQ